MDRSIAPPAYCARPFPAAFAEQMPYIETTAGLFRAAFAIAQHERPTANSAQAEVAVQQLVDTVRRRVHTPAPDAKLAHLRRAVRRDWLHGNVDDYYDPANSYLPEVLKSRRGLPITLVLVYKCVAEGVGLMVHGINSPGHFLAEVERCRMRLRPRANSRPSMYVDPFYGGGLLTEDDVFKRIGEATGQAVTPSPGLAGSAPLGRRWISRMLTNLQAVFASAGRERDLLAMQELQSLLDGSLT